MWPGRAVDDLDAWIDELIDASCAGDPIGMGVARRALGRLADQTAFRGGRTGLLDALVDRGLLRATGGGYAFVGEDARARLAELWRLRGPAGMTMLPARTRLDAGWTVAQGPVPTDGNKIEFLVDNEAAWGRLAAEIAGARTSVRGMLFMLDVPHVRMGFGCDPVGNPGPAGGIRLEECLLAAAERGAAVELVLNHVTPAISPANTCHPVERYFRRRDPAGRVRLRRLRTPQTLPIHGKVYVIDDRVAFLVGSGFAQEYFDGRAHLIDDPRRGRLRWRSSVRAPVHDVSARIEGPAVADLDATVRLHWDHACPSPRRPAGGESSPFRPSAAEEPPGKTTLQVTRTLNGGRRYTGLPAGETGIYESYLRALENAERFVYLENQYLTCPELVDALVRAVRRTPALELILLTNTKPDVPHYAAWQRRALERLLTGLGEDRDRAGVFTLWTHEKGPHRTRMLRIHVHSKVAIVDDAWLTVGSANLDALSLSHSQHELHRPPLVRLGRLLGGARGGDPWQARATEVNVTCVDDEGIGRLRRDLWAEHLGLVSADDPELVERPEQGWLELWRRRAALKLDGLRRADPTVTAPRILPYPHQAGRVPPRAHQGPDYLRALRVDPDLIEVRNRFRSFSFRHGRWRRR